MSALRFQWDLRKAAANRRKHRVSFTGAESVFVDEHALLMDDPLHSAAEDHFILLGSSTGGRLLIVAHAYRAAAGVIRIIPARKADRLERRLYEERDLS